MKRMWGKIRRALPITIHTTKPEAYERIGDWIVKTKFSKLFTYPILNNTKSWNEWKVQYGNTSKNN